METATQALHRLTSYEPGREWTEPAADPRVLQDIEVNDLARFPWFFKRYPGRCRASSCRATSRPRATQPSPSSPAPPPPPAPSSICRTSPGSCTSRPAWCARRSAPTGSRSSSAQPARRAAGSHSSCTSPCPRALRSPPACTGTTGTDTPSCRSARRRAGARPLWSSPASRGEPAGAIARRLPARLLGRGHHALPAARVRRLGGHRRLAPHPLPGRNSNARRCRRRARMARGGRRPRRRNADLDAGGPAAAGEVDAAPSSSRSSRAAQRAEARRARAALRTATPPPTCRRGRRSHRDRHPRAELAAPDGSLARPPAGRAPHLPRRGAARRRRPAPCRRARRRGHAAGRPWPDLSAPARRVRCGTSSIGCASTRARPRRGVRRHRRDRRRYARRPQYREAQLAAGLVEEAPPAGVRHGLERVRDDVPRQRGAALLGRRGRSALHVRRRAGVRVGPGWSSQQADRDPNGATPARLGPRSKAYDRRTAYDEELMVHCSRSSATSRA